MKESVILEMKNKVDTLGRVANQLIGEIKMLDERVGGIYMFLQQLPNYEEILTTLKERQKEQADEQREQDSKWFNSTHEVLTLSS